MSLAMKRIICWGAAAAVTIVALAFQIMDWEGTISMHPGIMPWVSLAVILLTCTGRWAGPVVIEEAQLAAFAEELKVEAAKSVDAIKEVLAEYLRAMEQQRRAEHAQFLAQMSTQLEALHVYVARNNADTSTAVRDLTRVVRPSSPSGARVPATDQARWSRNDTGSTARSLEEYLRAREDLKREQGLD